MSRSSRAATPVPPTQDAALADAVERTLAAVDAVVAAGAEAIEAATVRELATAAIRLHYVCAGDRDGFVPGPDTVSPSEALTLIASLLRAHDVSTFDLALWLSRTQQQ